MADVFALGVFIATLASDALDNLDAKLHPGYYYSLAYWLVSNVAFQFLHVPQPGVITNNERQMKFGNSFVICHLLFFGRSYYLYIPRLNNHPPNGPNQSST